MFPSFSKNMRFISKYFSTWERRVNVSGCCIYQQICRYIERLCYDYTKWPFWRIDGFLGKEILLGHLSLWKQHWFWRNSECKERSTWRLVYLLRLIISIWITINHIINECSKLAQREYQARHDWVGKVIHWEMCKKFKFDHTNKWYMHNPAPVLENASHKLLWDFNIQTDHWIPARRPDLIIINKKKKKKKKENLQNSRLGCPGWPQNKTERMWKEG